MEGQLLLGNILKGLFGPDLAGLWIDVKVLLGKCVSHHGVGEAGIRPSRVGVIGLDIVDKDEKNNRI